MRAEDLEALREDMLALIAAKAFALRDTIGNSALDERVMAAIRKVPRHEFVPIELQPYARHQGRRPRSQDRYRSWLSGRHPRAVGLIEIIDELGPRGEPKTPTAGLQQCRTQDCQWLSRLVRARPL